MFPRNVKKLQDRRFAASGFLHLTRAAIPAYRPQRDTSPQREALI